MQKKLRNILYNGKGEYRQTESGWEYHYAGIIIKRVNGKLILK